MERRQQRFINLPTTFISSNEYDLSPNATDAGPQINSMLADVAAHRREAGQDKAMVWIAPGNYNIATTIVHPAGVVVWGSGPNTTFFQQVGNIPLWTFANAFCRSELAYCSLFGAGNSNANDYSLRVNTGIDLDQTQYVKLHDIEVWDFLVGINISSGLAFSAYHDLHDLEVNRCTTGIQALLNANANTIRNSRVWFSFGAADEGVGIDVDDAATLNVVDNAIESCDTCVKLRSTTGVLQTQVNGNYFEPGSNPQTATVGSAYDVDIAVGGDESVHMEANTLSANVASAVLDPEGFSRVDSYSKQFFGARYDGAAQPRRNLMRNGYFLYYNSALIPAWTTGGTAPTIAENIVDQVTGVRCLQITANAANSSFFQLFEASDQGTGFVTVGFRYQVLAGNVGFLVSATVGGGAVHQWVDPTPDPGTWKVGYVQCAVGGVNRNGQAIILPDFVNGTGAVLIDEVWAVPGRFAVASPQYGERIEMLEAPIQIATTGPVAATTPWGPVNILDLPSVLAPPLDDFSAAPEGVIGAVVRLEIAVFALPNTPLPNPYSLSVNVPAAGAVVAASTDSVIAVYGSTAHDGQFLVRSTSLSGTLTLAAANGTLGTVFLCGWILQ